MAANQRFEGACILKSRHEQGIHSGFDAELTLNQGEGKKDGTNRTLLRLQREFSKRFSRQDCTHSGSNGPQGVVFASLEGFDRNVGGKLRSNENGVARLNAELCGKGRAQQGIPICGRVYRDPVEVPEPFIHTINRDLTCFAFTALHADETLSKDHRSNFPDTEVRISSNTFGELLSDEARRQNNLLRLAEAFRN
jgi:hypothetical protein